MPPKRKSDAISPESSETPKRTKRQEAIEQAKQNKILAEQTARENAQAERARLAEQASTRPTGNPGERNDGRFYMSFIEMGQGDCAIICTPEGRIIMVDCGTNSQDKELAKAYLARIKGVLQLPKYLGKSKAIDMLILTHPDKDHYNRLEKLTDDFQILSVYHSSTISGYGTAGTWLSGLTDLIQRVTLNKDGTTRGENSLGGGAIPAIVDGESKVGRFDATLNGLIVVDEPGKCQITLLASDVAYDYAGDDDGAEHRNRGSIVTLIEVFSRRILLCGDATRSTEHFLLLNANREAKLKDLDIVQAGHHGSDVTSSSQRFVQKLNAKHRVIISTGRRGQASHHLPGWAVIDRYVNQFTADSRANDPKSHAVSAWDITKSLANPFVYDIYQPVYTTGSSGTWSFDIGSDGVIK
jgi:beta-lactamase superfamily II metal-dependent hydrolase